MILKTIIWIILPTGFTWSNFRLKYQKTKHFTLVFSNTLQKFQMAGRLLLWQFIFIVLLFTLFIFSIFSIFSCSFSSFLSFQFIVWFLFHFFLLYQYYQIFRFCQLCLLFQFFQFFFISSIFFLLFTSPWIFIKSSPFPYPFLSHFLWFFLFLSLDLSLFPFPFLSPSLFQFLSQLQLNFQDTFKTFIHFSIVNLPFFIISLFWYTSLVYFKLSFAYPLTRWEVSQKIYFPSLFPFYQRTLIFLL